MTDSDSEGWTVVARFSSEAEASIACGMLDSHGIPAQLTGTVLASVYPMTDTWAPVVLMVPADEAPRASRLLRDARDA